MTRIILALKSKDRNSFNHLKPQSIVDKDPVQIMFLLEAFDLMYSHYKSKKKFSFSAEPSGDEQISDSQSSIATLIRDVVSVDGNSTNGNANSFI